MKKELQGKQAFTMVGLLFSSGYVMITEDGEVIKRDDWDRGVIQNVDDDELRDCLNDEDTTAIELNGFVFPEKFYMYHYVEPGDKGFWYSFFFEHMVPAEWCRHIVSGFPDYVFEYEKFRGDLKGKRPSKKMVALNELVELSSLGAPDKQSQCKGDLIDLKITGQDISWGKYVTRFGIKNKSIKSSLKKFSLIADHPLTKDEIIQICKDQGTDINNLTQKDWEETAIWDKLNTYLNSLFKEASSNYDGKILVTNTYKCVVHNVYLITFKLHWGENSYRLFKLPIELDLEEYREEVGFNITIPEYIEGELDTLLDPEYWGDDYTFKWNMTKEEWEDDKNFEKIKSYVDDQFDYLSWQYKALKAEENK